MYMNVRLRSVVFCKNRKLIWITREEEEGEEEETKSHYHLASYSKEYLLQAILAWSGHTVASPPQQHQKHFHIPLKIWFHCHTTDRQDGQQREPDEQLHYPHQEVWSHINASHVHDQRTSHFNININHSWLTTINLNRLEAATSRLEDMASTLESSNESSAAPQRSPSSPYPPPAHPSPAHPHPHSHHPSPAQPKSSSSGPAAGSPAVSGSSDVPKTVQEFDDIINTDVKEFVELGEKLGEPVSGQVNKS